MFILAKRNILLHTADHSDSFQVRKGALMDVPERFCGTVYFDALVKDGKIAVPTTKKDRDVVAADENAEKTLEKAEKKSRKAKD